MHRAERGHADPSRATRQRALLVQIQQLLQQIYDADSPHRVDEFVITDEALARRLQGGSGVRQAAETLLLREVEGGVDLSLYLHADVLARLAGTDPVRDLDPRHLGDFCTVLEGVSDFIYVTWNAGFERAVTPLELEMQAEVDKFVGAGLLMTRQGRAGAARDLHRRLFEAFSWAEGLTVSEREMYRDASELAARYCRSLQARYLDSGNVGGLMRELRRFWRQPRDGKISRIRELAA